MASINTVVVTGNLTRDPELRHTPSGSAVCSLRVAVNAREKVNGEWTDRANYFDVRVWGNMAESCAQYLSKGRKVGVMGRLRWEEWEDQATGSKRQKVVIVAENVEFLTPKGEGSAGESAFRAPEGGGEFFPAAATSDFGGGGGLDDPDQDIPFMYD